MQNLGLVGMITIEWPKELAGPFRAKTVSFLGFWDMEKNSEWNGGKLCEEGTNRSRHGLDYICTYILYLELTQKHREECSPTCPGNFAEPDKDYLPGKQQQQQETQKKQSKIMKRLRL